MSLHCHFPPDTPAAVVAACGANLVRDLPGWELGGEFIVATALLDYHAAAVTFLEQLTLAQLFREHGLTCDSLRVAPEMLWAPCGERRMLLWRDTSDGRWRLRDPERIESLSKRAATCG